MPLPLRRPLQPPPRIYPPPPPPPTAPPLTVPQLHQQPTNQASHIPLLQPQKPQINSNQKPAPVRIAIKAGSSIENNNNVKWSRQQPLGSTVGGSHPTEAIYETLASQSHIYEVIDTALGPNRLASTSRSLLDKPKVPPRNGSKASYKPQRYKLPPTPAPRRAAPVGGDVAQSSQMTMMLEQTSAAPHVLQPNVLKYFQQKLYESFGSGGGGDGQPQKAALEAVCGAVESLPNKVNRFDAMLETAQFLATAAYLER